MVYKLWPTIYHVPNSIGLICNQNIRNDVIQASFHRTGQQTHSQMLLTRSSTDRTAGRHATQKLCRGKFRNRVDGEGLYFPGGGFRLLWGRSPRGLCLCHTAISHCDAGIQREKERKRDYWSKAAKNDSNMRRDEKRRASFVPNSFLGDRIRLFLFAPLALWIDCERQSGSSTSGL